MWMAENRGAAKSGLIDESVLAPEKATGINKRQDV
jgi:hypothetical protein